MAVSIEDIKVERNKQLAACEMKIAQLQILKAKASTANEKLEIDLEKLKIQAKRTDIEAAATRAMLNLEGTAAALQALSQVTDQLTRTAKVMVNAARVGSAVAAFLTQTNSVLDRYNDLTA